MFLNELHLLIDKGVYIVHPLPASNLTIDLDNSNNKERGNNQNLMLFNQGTNDLDNYNNVEGGNNQNLISFHQGSN